ncbi:MAG: response regulator [Deltaproteobacteria bacterium]|nr:response regulator [Deltaproteobacteria bacterium]
MKAKKAFILLVEDNPNDVELTRRALKGQGIHEEIVHVADGVEALDFLFGEGMHRGRDTGHKPVVVLLDLKMPKIDGLQVLKRIRAHPLTDMLPVVILTTSNEERDLMDSYRFGANSYVRKPINYEEFSEVIGQIGKYWLLINEFPPYRRS